MLYHIDKKNLRASVRELYKRGGPYQRAANVIYSILAKTEDPDIDPFQGVALTNHGESRIPKCIKYNLSNACRLITVVENGHCYLLFAGDHKACDKWLEVNRGYVPVLDKDGRFALTYRSPNSLSKAERVSGEPHIFSDKLLYF